MAAAFERVLVSEGWHLPRWRTSNREYGSFYTPPHPAAAAAVAPRVCGTWAECRDSAYHRQASGSSTSSSSACGRPLQHQNNAVQYDDDNDGDARHHIHFDKQIDRAATADAISCDSSINENNYMIKRHYDHGSHGKINVQDDPPIDCSKFDKDDGTTSFNLDGARVWKPKPLKPMILFEKKAREIEKERLIGRIIPYKRKKSGEWLQPPSPSPKRQQIHLPTTNGDSTHPATRRYSYYKYYGYGGQGAKTSWGHNLPLGQKPPFSRRTRDLLD